ncbi:MAG: GIY-YIG nuclease family protein [Planctomycetes bacterium]|nr:GIY-YIG nuclease family protein [Planctomycetota bacterium]
MKLQLEWGRPVRLVDASQENMLYGVDLSRVSEEAGIYIFGRQYGQKFEALYVGQALRLRTRVKQHLNNLKRMKHLDDAKTGKRVVLGGTLITRQGQRLEKCLDIAERALIRHFLSEGHDLVNKQGTKLRQHEILSSGKHRKRSFPKSIFVA